MNDLSSRLLRQGCLLLASLFPLLAQAQTTTYQAEAHSKESGLSYETTADVGGGKNAKDISTDDYIEWNIPVATAGDYTLTTRSATWASAKLDVLINGSKVTSLSLAKTYTGTGSKEQTWASFTTSAFPLAAGSHKLRIVFKSASQNLNWVALNQVSGAAQSRVEIRVPVVDDHLYLSINGLRTHVARFGQTIDTWMDISHLFRNGTNDLRVQGVNLGGPGQLEVEIRVNGGTPVRVACLAASGCLAPDAEDLFFDQSVSLPSLTLPAAQAVKITSSNAGKIYINDQHLGLSTPATLQLPPGKYLVGVGISTDTSGAFTGKFFEREITVSNEAVNIDFTSSSHVSGVKKAARIGVLPIRRSYDAALGRTAVLKDADVTKAIKVIDATRTMWFKPFSYGLGDWTVTRLATEESWTAPIADTCTILEQSRYASLIAEGGPYDFIVVLGSEVDANGAHLYGGVGAYATGHCVAIPNTAFDATDSTPNGFVLHEFLHQYESKQKDYHRQYTGTENLHGAEEHGYWKNYNGELDWMYWYRLFIRGQVGETAEMKIGVTLSAPTAAPRYHVGTFSSVKYGLRTPAPR